MDHKKFDRKNWSTMFCEGTVKKFLLSNFLWSITPLFEPILLHMCYKMCSKSGVMDHKKFDSKNFSTVRNTSNNMFFSQSYRSDMVYLILREIEELIAYAAQFDHLHI